MSFSSVYVNSATLLGFSCKETLRALLTIID